MNEISSEITRLGSVLQSEETFSIEYQNEVDFAKLCRTCLRETTDNDLANEALCIISADGKLVRVYEMFEAATGLKVESNDSLPHHLCSPCLKLVNSSYTFRIQSQRSYEILQRILDKVKQEAVSPLGEYQPDDEYFPEDDEEEQEVLESSKVSDAIEPTSVAEESTDDVWIDDEIMEIEQLDEVFEPDEEYEATKPDEKYEVLNMEVPGPDNDFTCPFCSTVFFLQREIIQHCKLEHPKEKPYKCGECLATFTHIQSMRRHKKTHVASSKKKMCALCSRLFHRSDDLKRHIRTHTHERPYSCAKCQKAFKQHTELKDHMLSHTEEKMYKCTLCAKEWRSRNGWYLHMKAHQDGKNSQGRKPKKKIIKKLREELVFKGETATIGT